MKGHKTRVSAFSLIEVYSFKTRSLINQLATSNYQVYHNHDLCSSDCSTKTSKMNVLVNKLHEYLANSPVEDSNGPPTSEDANGAAFDVIL